LQKWIAKESAADVTPRRASIVFRRERGGSNTFAFGPGAGQDKVMDFQTDQDVIQFNPALFANYAAVMQDTTQVGVNTVIQHDANTSLTLENTLASNLTATNFHFS
jgi:hypothetical protein